MDRNIDQLVEEIVPEIVELRHQIHSNPELGFEEWDTSKLVADYLRSLSGLEVRTGIAKTGVVGVLAGDRDGPAVMLRADMDALPIAERTGRDYASKVDGKMHACGHDGHTACLLGAARVLSEIVAELRGPVVFAFQPGEEGFGGARVMIQEGVLASPKVAAAFGMHGHPGLEIGQVAVRGGPIMGAQDRIEIEVRGSGGHASAPHLCVDPVFIGAQIINGLQGIVARSTDPFHAVVVTISVFQAGTVGNVIPDTAMLRGTIRTLTAADRLRVHREVRSISEGIASAHGGDARVVIEAGYPVLVNDSGAADFVRKVGDEVAPKGCAEFQPILGAEDFAYYAEECPAAFWFLGLRDGSESHPNWHEATFDFNDAAIPHAIRMHVELARRFAA